MATRTEQTVNIEIVSYGTISKRAFRNLLEDIDDSSNVRLSGREYDEQDALIEITGIFTPDGWTTTKVTSTDEIEDMARRYFKNEEIYVSEPF